MPRRMRIRAARRPRPRELDSTERIRDRRAAHGAAVRIWKQHNQIAACWADGVGQRARLDRLGRTAGDHQRGTGNQRHGNPAREPHSFSTCTAIVVQGQQFEVIGASKIAIYDGRIVKGAQERNGGKKKYFFMGPGEKYDLTKLERVGKPKPAEP